jgi:hypothetical protein
MFPTLLSSAITQMNKEAVDNSIARHQAREAKRRARAADGRRREREPRDWFRAIRRV